MYDQKGEFKSNLVNADLTFSVVSSHSLDIPRHAVFDISLLSSTLFLSNLN